ncbi:SH3/SH2 adaptor activity protein [Homalodisca vitripennis]|nr:SH3/SH2 adaptor activity protein [Homalodisca vitripennis]
MGQIGDFPFASSVKTGLHCSDSDSRFQARCALTVPGHSRHSSVCAELFIIFENTSLPKTGSHERLTEVLVRASRSVPVHLPLNATSQTWLLESAKKSVTKVIWRIASSHFMCRKYRWNWSTRQPDSVRLKQSALMSPVIALFIAPLTYKLAVPDTEIGLGISARPPNVLTSSGVVGGGEGRSPTICRRRRVSSEPQRCSGGDRDDRTRYRTTRAADQLRSSYRGKNSTMNGLWRRVKGFEWARCCVLTAPPTTPSVPHCQAGPWALITTGGVDTASAVSDCSLSTKRLATALGHDVTSKQSGQDLQSLAPASTRWAITPPEREMEIHYKAIVLPLVSAVEGTIAKSVCKAFLANTDHTFACSTDHTFARSTDNTFARSTDHTFTRSADHTFTRSTDHIFTRSTDHTFTRSTDHTFARSTDHTFARSTDHTFTRMDDGERGNLQLFARISDFNIYTTINAKNHLRAPTEFGLCLRAPGQDDPGELRCLACENERARTCWLTAMRLAKYGKQLRENYRAFKNKQQMETLNPRDYSSYTVPNVSTVSECPPTTPIGHSSSSYFINLMCSTCQMFEKKLFVLYGVINVELVHGSEQMVIDKGAYRRSSTAA